MKILAFLFAILFSFSASAMTYEGMYYQRYCYEDVNICVTYNLIPSNGMMRVLFEDEKDLLKIYGNTEVPKFYSDGVYHQKMMTVGWTEEAKRQLSTETIKANLKRDLDEMAQIPDEQWNYDRDRRLCTIGSVVCVVSLASAILSGGSAIPLAVLTCGATVYACADAYRSYYKWQKWKREIEEAHGIKRDSDGRVLNKQGTTGPTIDIPGGSPRPSDRGSHTGSGGGGDVTSNPNPGRKDPTGGFENPPDLPSRFGRIVSETAGTPSVPMVCIGHSCDPEPARQTE